MWQRRPRQRLRPRWGRDPCSYLSASATIEKNVIESRSSPLLPDIAARVSLHVAHDEPPNNISGKTKLDSARWRGMGQSTNYAKNDGDELPSMHQPGRGWGGITVPALVHLNDSVVNWACISPYDSHPPLAGVPDINTHNHGGTETVCRRTGSCGRTCTYIVGSVSSAPSWCTTTTVTRTHVVGWRPIGHALARSPCGTYMYRFLVHMCRYWGRGADGQRNMHRHPMPNNIDRELEHRHSMFGVQMFIILRYIRIAIEGRGASDGAPAPATRHASARISINIDR